MHSVKFDSIVGFLPVNIHLDQPEKDEITASFEIHRLKKNEHFLSEGCHVHLIGAVTQGILYRYHQDQKGNLHIDQFICNDYFFTECKCYKSNLPSCSNIKAVTPCEIITISTRSLEALKQVKPKYELLIQEITSGVMQGRKDIDEMFLTGSKRDRGNRFNSYYKLWLPYIQKELVSTYLQMSRSEYYLIQKK